jgi:hypothetical protein
MRFAYLAVVTEFGEFIGKARDADWAVAKKQGVSESRTTG